MKIRNESRSDSNNDSAMPRRNNRKRQHTTAAHTLFNFAMSTRQLEDSCGRWCNRRQMMVERPLQCQCWKGRQEYEQLRRFSRSIMTPTRTEVRSPRPYTPHRPVVSSSAHAPCDGPASTEHEPPDNLRCPITFELMNHPVVCKDGRTYERNAIIDWIVREGTSPFTRETLEPMDVWPNKIVEDIIDQWKQEHSVPPAFKVE